MDRIYEEHSSTGFVFFNRTLPPKMVGPERLDLCEELETFDFASSLDLYLEASLFLCSEWICLDYDLRSDFRFSE